MELMELCKKANLRFSTIQKRVWQYSFSIAIIRKKGKLPPNTVETTFDYEKEYGKDQLELPKLVKETYKNKNFYILDDIYATGNTMKAIQKAIEELGGKILGKGVIMNIVGLNHDENVFSLLEVEEEQEEQMKNKGEKGSATIFVVGICLFAIILLMAFVTNIENKKQAQDKEINRIEKRYSVENSEMEEIYSKTVDK